MFLYDLICIHGCTRIQINDQGREFVNQVSARLFQLTGTAQRITSAYHPQANGLVERSNRTVQGALLKVLENEQDRWPEALNGVLFAIRTSKHKSTGYSPFYMLYGRNAVIPVCHEEHSLSHAQSTERYSSETLNSDTEMDMTQFNEVMDHMTRVKQIVFQKASENIEKAQTRQKKDYDKRHRDGTCFNTGDVVLLWNMRRADRKGGKQTKPWLGPYEIQEVHENGTYTLRNKKVTLKTKAAGSNLKMFHERESQPTKEKDGLYESVVEIVNEEDCPAWVFQPVDEVWQSEKCKEFQLEFRKPFPSTLRGVALGNPADFLHVEGDGNCWFRCLSLVLTGSQDDYKQIRNAIVKFMVSEPASTLLKTHHKFATTEEYVRKSKMLEDTIWATDLEILATASMLESDVFVFGTYGNRQAWQQFCANELKPSCIASEKSIYIRLQGNHYDCVTGV